MADAKDTKGERAFTTLNEKNPNILFIIARSKNLNIVVYEALRSGDKLEEKKPLDVYWLDQDPEYVKAARKKGKVDDREDLNMLEKQFAYGLTATPIGDGRYKVVLVALPAREITLSVDAAGKAHAQLTISGKPCDLQRIFVHSIDRTLRTPKVEYIELFGVDASGAAAYEKITP